MESIVEGMWPKGGNIPEQVAGKFTFMHSILRACSHYGVSQRFLTLSKRPWADDISKTVPKIVNNFITIISNLHEKCIQIKYRHSWIFFKFYLIYLFEHTLLYQRHTSNWRCVHNVVHVYRQQQKEKIIVIYNKRIYTKSITYNHTELIQDVSAVHARFRYDLQNTSK